jgi:hypothetical protein
LQKIILSITYLRKACRRADQNYNEYNDSFHDKSVLKLQFTQLDAMYNAFFGMVVEGANKDSRIGDRAEEEVIFALVGTVDNQCIRISNLITISM